MQFPLFKQTITSRSLTTSIILVLTFTVFITGLIYLGVKNSLQASTADTHLSLTYTRADPESNGVQSGEVYTGIWTKGSRGKLVQGGASLPKECSLGTQRTCHTQSGIPLLTIDCTDQGTDITCTESIITGRLTPIPKPFFTTPPGVPVTKSYLGGTATCTSQADESFKCTASWTGDIVLPPPPKPPKPPKPTNPTPYVYLLLRGPADEEIPFTSVNDAVCPSRLRQDASQVKNGKVFQVKCTYAGTNTGTYEFTAKAATGGVVTPQTRTIPATGALTITLRVGVGSCRVVRDMNLIGTVHAQENCPSPSISPSPSPKLINGKILEVVRENDKDKLKPMSRLFVCILFNGSANLDCLKPDRARLVQTDSEGVYAAQLPSSVESVTLVTATTANTDDPRKNIIEWFHEQSYVENPTPPQDIPSETSSSAWIKLNKPKANLAVSNTFNLIVGRSCPTITVETQQNATWTYIESNVYDILCRLWTMGENGQIKIPWSRGTLAVMLPRQINCTPTKNPNVVEMACDVLPALPSGTTFVPLIQVNLSGMERSMKSFGGVNGVNTQPWLQWALGHELCHFIFGHTHTSFKGSITQEQMVDECGWYLVKAVHPEWYTLGNKRRWESIFYTDFRVNFPIELRTAKERLEYYNTYMKARHNNMLTQVRRIIPQ